MNLLVHVILAFIAIVAIVSLVVAGIDEWRGVL